MLDRRLTLLGVLLLALALADCAASSSSENASGGNIPGIGGSGGAAGGSGGSGASGGSGGGTLPPEKELESSFRSPVATGKYVWAANPDSGRVALVDATTLEVHVVDAGFGPTYLAALPDPTNPDANAAIVINVGSHDATVLRADDSGNVAAQSVPIHQDANSWAISHSGHWAIAWTDAAKVKNPDPTDGLQDITVIDLSGKDVQATRLSVGYRPTRVVISQDDKRAFAVTEPGISVIDLGASGPEVLDDVPVTDDPLENPASRDVSITPDGAFALVRRDGSPDVNVVSLSDGTRVKVTLSSNVTDLDLAQDGSQAIAVARDTSEVALLPIPQIYTKPADYSSVNSSGEVFGSVSTTADGATALLYTNAVANDHLTILVARPGPNFLTYRTVALKAPIRAVFPSPDGAHAIALLDPGAGSVKPGAFSVVPIASTLPPRIQGTDAPAQSVAIEPSPSTRGLVTTRDDVTRIHEAYLVSMPSLQIQHYKLASPPLASGMVPEAGVAYVAQEHPEGRITFIKLSDGSARTLTGFELGARIVDGSQ
jgi:hypothetical protein